MQKLDPGTTNPCQASPLTNSLYKYIYPLRNENQGSPDEIPTRSSSTKSLSSDASSLTPERILREGLLRGLCGGFEIVEVCLEKGSCHISGLDYVYRGLCGGGFGIFKMCLREGSCHIIGVYIL